MLESDVYSALEGERFDVIISNPPFHQERDISYGPSTRLIDEAPEHLNAKGQLILVANAFLPYPERLQRAWVALRRYPITAVFGCIALLNSCYGWP